jgi:Glutathione S-transferase
MADPTYVPPKVWNPETVSGGRFAGINRPTAGARSEKALPEGDNPFQLYSLATPNGVKVTVMLEELLEAGHAGAEYDAFTVNIGEGDQFTSGFVAANPNSKIPALIDKSGPAPFRVFESGAILVHLAEKFGAFLPADPAKRAEVLSWVFWQVGTGPFIGGGFGHFYAYAPEKSNTRSTAMRWRPSASSTSPTGGWRKAGSLAGRNIPSPISPTGRGWRPSSPGKSTTTPRPS